MWLEWFHIYLLNLGVTLAMFLILTFRAWIELKNYRIMWKELEWGKTREGGKELYTLLCELFRVAESQ